MFIWDWFTAGLEYLGLWKKPRYLLFFGLDNAGTTTLLHMLRDGKPRRPLPTVPVCYPFSALEELSIGNRTYIVLELAGAQSRRMWSDFCPAIHAIVFLIDANERCRFFENMHELDAILNDESLINCPVLILGNKIDLPGAATEDELKQFCGLFGQTTGKGKVPRRNLPSRPLELFMCSGLRRKGYDEAFRWLEHYID